MANPQLITLAKEGKDAWNARVQKYSGATFDFSNATLTAVSFAGFKFPGSVIFTDVTFSMRTDFAGATFSEHAIFTGATFPMFTIFTDATFSEGATFDGATFSKWTHFAGATFSEWTSFNGATFFEWVNFTGATFESVDFSNVKFEESASFRETTFTQVPIFHNASIHQGTIFGDIDKFFTGFQSNVAERGYRTLKLAMGQYQARTEEAAFAALELKARRYRLMQEANPMRQARDCLRKARGLLWKAKDLSQEEKDLLREAKDLLRKAKARPFWKCIPLWAECLGYWLWEKFSKSGRSFLMWEARDRLRKARDLMREARDHLREAKDLLRKAKAKPFWKRISLWAECLGYWSWEFFSNSGRSFSRPFGLYLAFWLVFAALYVLPCQGWRGDWWTGLRYSFFKQFPFAAAFRGGPNRIADLETMMFGTGLPPGWVDALNSVQALIALILIFLMGLGIRHKFRLR